MITFGTLFSGIGAPEQALKSLGIPHQLTYACDFDPAVKTTFLYNYKCQHFYDDVTKISHLPYTDILVFGSPCQAFSYAGHRRGLGDSRGRLLYTTLDLIAETLPRVVVMENVVGLATYENGSLLKDIIGRFEKMGYVVSYAILNGVDYGIPQHRERLFVVATHFKFQFPAPTAKQSSLKRFIFPVSSPELVTRHFLSKPKVQRKLYGWKHDYMPCLTHTLSRRGSSSEFISCVAATHKATGQLRSPTVDEVRRLFGFPATFNFPDDISTTKRLNMFTNSMVVPVVAAILNPLVSALSCEFYIKNKKLVDCNKSLCYYS